MRLRTGKIITSGVTVPVTTSKPTATAPLHNTVIQASNPRPTTTVDPANYMQMNTKHRESKPKTTIAVLTGLVNSVQTGTIPEKMMKVSLIYDIILADAEFCRHYSDSRLLNVICEKASMHLDNIQSESVLQKLNTEELRAAQHHFRCVLEKFIDKSFGTPADYSEYSYHYDIMRKIGYEAALQKRAEIFNYAYDIDYDEHLIREYITNEVTVYELYAMVTYNTYEALPNNVSYDYCFNEVLSWYIRDKRD